MVAVKKVFYKVSDDLKCPHCGKGGDNIDRKLAEYITDVDRTWMESNVGYQWTEDYMCSNCGECYSIINGC